MQRRAVAHAIGASSGSVVGSIASGPRMMSSFEPPAGTIGNTISRRVDPEVDHDASGRSTEYAFSIAVSTSSGVSTRRPTAP